MVALQPIPGLAFHEDQHRYTLNGRYLAHSVTGVVSDLSPQAKRHIEATRHEWEPRGNAVHAALEAFLLGEAIPSGGDYADLIDPLLEHPLWQNAEVLACEYRLCDQRKSVGGSFDFLVRTPKKLILGDLKTVSREQAIDARKPATAQLGAYAAMLIDHHPTLSIDTCLTVVAGPGRTRLIPQDPSECIAAWLDAWDAFKLLQPDF